jgi:hypothetical protein
VSGPEILLPAEAARRLGVPTRLIIEAIHQRKLPRFRLEDGPLGVAADALNDFQVPSSWGPSSTPSAGRRWLSVVFSLIASWSERPGA